MKNKTKLILVEGLCGTGKSTLAENLYKYLLQNGKPAKLYSEGAPDHPTSLNGYAFFRIGEYNELLVNNPSDARYIEAMAILGTDYALVPYRETALYERNDSLLDTLKAHELCWTDKPPASMAEFSKAIREHWERFASKAAKQETIFILDGTFLQHQIHDLVRNYQAGDADIFDHIYGISGKIAELCPVLIYLSQPDVRAQQMRIAQIRSKPHYAEEQSILFMQDRKRIEKLLLGNLPFPAYEIENTSLDWDWVFSEAMAAVDKELDV